MKLKELLTYSEYEIPYIEFYNEFGELEYMLNLNDYEFDDIDIEFGYYYEPYGIIKLRRENGQTKLNGKNIQPPKGEF